MPPPLYLWFVCVGGTWFWRFWAESESLKTNRPRSFSRCAEPLMRTQLARSALVYNCTVSTASRPATALTHRVYSSNVHLSGACTTQRRAIHNNCIPPLLVADFERENEGVEWETFTVPTRRALRSERPVRSSARHSKRENEPSRLYHDCVRVALRLTPCVCLRQEGRCAVIDGASRSLVD